MDLELLLTRVHIVFRCSSVDVIEDGGTNSAGAILEDIYGGKILALRKVGLDVLPHLQLLLEPLPRFSHVAIGDKGVKNRARYSRVKVESRRNVYGLIGGSKHIGVECCDGIWGVISVCC